MRDTEKRVRWCEFIEEEEEEEGGKLLERWMCELERVNGWLYIQLITKEILYNKESLLINWKGPKELMEENIRKSLSILFYIVYLLLVRVLN